jgi:ribosomal protein S18 acetylase RimI-like enzyme
MSNDAFTIRPMTRDEIGRYALEWAAREGWNPGLDDAAAFYAADPEGFLLGELDGEPVGCISAVRYGEDFGFLGFYIVQPEWRGKGYGMRLWRAALDALGGRTAGLDGVVAQQANYRKSGFQLAYRNIRYRLEQPRREIAMATGTRREFIHAGQIPLDELAAFDRRFFPADRNNFLRQWIRLPHGTAIATLDEKENLTGYGVVRACREGSKIGPLFAEDPRTARALFAVLAGEGGEGDVYLDVPEPNTMALSLVAESFGMEKVFETARMYKGAPPALPIDKIFGVTTFELG